MWPSVHLAARVRETESKRRLEPRAIGQHCINVICRPVLLCVDNSIRLLVVLVLVLVLVVQWWLRRMWVLVVGWRLLV